MLRAAGAVPALAVPQGDEREPVAAKSSRRGQHPLIVALEGILAFRQRAQLIGRDV
jgi:hypothetical protein